MVNVLDHNEAVNFDEFSRSTYYIVEHDGVDLDEVIRSSEDRQSAVESDYSDFCMPVEDWMLD